MISRRGDYAVDYAAVDGLRADEALNARLRLSCLLAFSMNLVFE
jgi:hypothetical protein